MAGVNIDDSELGTLDRDFSTAMATTPSRAGRAVGRSADDIAADARRLVPVRTGELRESISIENLASGAVVGPTAAHGGYVEEGTSEMAPQPYMRPAFDKNLPILVDEIADVGEGALGG